MKLHRVAPNINNVNVVVKILSKRVLVDKTTSDGSRQIHIIYTVADDTGSMLVDVHKDIQIPVGSVITLHNAVVKLFQNKMRLSLGKWGSVEPTTRIIRGDVRMDPNHSDVVYKSIKI